MVTSRLKKATTALLTSLNALTEYCDKLNLPNTIHFYDRVLPTQELKDQFTEGYGIRELPPLNLPIQGFSTALVFESKAFVTDDNKAYYPPQTHPNAVESFHAEAVAAICQQVGAGLQAGVNTLLVGASLNPNYLKAFEPQHEKAVKALIKNQGVPVIVTSIGWNDLYLLFDSDLEKQKNSDDIEVLQKYDDAEAKASHFWSVAAFIIDSAGNEGRFGEKGDIQNPRQKHNIISHAAPLLVRVGAAAYDKIKGWVTEGYSSANGVTFVAPVLPKTNMVWRFGRRAEPITGTSAGGPYAGGVFVALNRRYGAYLTREQILFAVIATCIKITRVSADGKKTPEALDISYTTNAAGLGYNPDYNGFGLIDPHKADHLLGHMVALTQKAQERVTIPTEEHVRMDFRDVLSQTVGDDGLYYYKVPMPAGYALKTTIEVEFEKANGKIVITSPSGTSFPMHMSVCPAKDQFFGLSTSHAWTGEPLAGDWIIASTEPISRLGFRQHHFLENDIIHGLDVDALDKQPWPDFANCVPLEQFGSHHAFTRELHLDEIKKPQRPGFLPIQKLGKVIARIIQ